MNLDDYKKNYKKCVVSVKKTPIADITAQTKIEELSKEVYTNINKVSDLNEKVVNKAEKNEVNNLKESLDSLKGQIETITSNLDTVKQDNHETDSLANSNKTLIEELTTTVSNNKSEFDTYKEANDLKITETKAEIQSSLTAALASYLKAEYNAETQTLILTTLNGETVEHITINGRTII